MIAPGGVPHVGGPIIGVGCQTVLINDQPAATVGDPCFCNGGLLDKITTGSSGVFFEGKPAARKGDQCAHGGVIIGGSGTVVIGEWMGDAFYKVGDEVEPFSEEKRLIIDQAIKDCIALLERKLRLMEEKDPETEEAFTKWFGKHGEMAKETILERIRRALEVSRTLTVGNFYDIEDEHEKRDTCAFVYPEGILRRFKLGDIFWKEEAKGKGSRSGTIIHELSHFKDVGGTEDVTYGEDDCLQLAEDEPHEAFKNADSFEYFVIA